MMHGQCGLNNVNCPCMEDGKYFKHYSMRTRDTTSLDGNGHVLYHCRNYSWYVKKCTRDQIFSLYTWWIVPYNPYLVRNFNCHINMEVCSSVKTIKYLKLYIFKGLHSGVVEMNEVMNEIKEFIEGHYVAA